MTNIDYIQTLRDKLPEIQQNFGVTSLSVFGSMARGDNKSESDIDILVEMPPKILIVSALRQYLESTLHLSVDLIRNHSRLSSSFRSQISHDAIKLL